MNIDELRKQIDTLDEKLIEVLGKRMELVKEIGEIKKQHGAEFLDVKRWQQVLNKVANKAKSIQVSENLIKQIFTAIHEHSLDLQKK